MSRAEEAARRAELAAARARGESLQAQKLIDVFVAAAKDKGIAPHPLRATLYSGQSVKTDKVGWYLRKNQSVAIGDDGAYYVLVVPGGLRERLSGVKLRPSPPPLIVGEGGRDGETAALADFLQWRLEPGWTAS
jgi:putative intracellular protease/amidase